MPPRKTVCIVAEYPYSLMQGGLQVQATKTIEILRGYSPQFDYVPFDWTTTRQADLYHFLSLPRYMMEITRLVRLAGKPFVCTLLLGNRNDLNRWWRDRAKRLFDQPCYSKALEHASTVIAITEKERQSIIQSYGVPEGRTTTIPHGVDDGFFHPSAEIWRKQRGDAPFLLCVGAVQPRKNQLLLVEAANAAKVGVVLIGPVLTGREDYGRKVAEAIKINEQWNGTWIPGLPSDDPLLISAYAAARGLVLLSEHETQPISILQAMASAKPVLLGDSGYAHVAPFHALEKVSLKDPVLIRQALRHLWEKGAAIQLDSSYQWQEIAHHLAHIYEGILAP